MDRVRFVDTLNVGIQILPGAQNFPIRPWRLESVQEAMLTEGSDFRKPSDKIDQIYKKKLFHRPPPYWRVVSYQLYIPAWFIGLDWNDVFLVFDHKYLKYHK